MPSGLVVLMRKIHMNLLPHTCRQALRPFKVHNRPSMEFQGFLIRNSCFIMCMFEADFVLLHVCACVSHVYYGQ